MSAIPPEVARSYGNLPNTWRLEKLKFSARVRNSNVDKKSEDGEEPVRLCNYTDVYYNDRITPDMDFMEATATESEIERFTLRQGQVIITKDSEGWDDIGIPAYVTENMPGVLCGYHLSVLEPDGENLDGGFLSWLCRADPLNDQFKLGSNGVTRYGLGQYPLKSSYVPLPDLDTQRRIAGYLDDKTARIDALIEKKRALLDRLAEKRQALITRAVTRGLNPDAPLKDSGIDWLGKVPAHWEVKKLKYLTPRVSVGIVVTPASWYAEEGVLALRGLNIRPMGFNLQETRLISDDGHEFHAKSELREGDLVSVRTGDPGTTAVVTKKLEGSNCVDLVIIRRPLEMLPEYLGWFLNSNVAKVQYQLGSEGALQAHFNVDTSKETLIAVAPRDEQFEIVKYLESALTAHDAVVGQIVSSVLKLAEYRAALVTAAVTGKIAALLIEADPKPANSDAAAALQPMGR